jgi:hypothetical protein
VTIPAGKILDLSLLYEELQTIEDVFSARAVQVKLIFEAECNALYEATSEDIRKKFTARQYQGAMIVPELNAYLGRQSGDQRA